MHGMSDELGELGFGRVLLIPFAWRTLLNNLIIIFKKKDKTNDNEI